MYWTPEWVVLEECCKSTETGISKVVLNPNCGVVLRDLLSEQWTKASEEECECNARCTELTNGVTNGQH